MKMVKSLLLGSAAGFVAIAGAQAADLPVKAKPVQYVKICSLYGAGFYYIPGTDMCLKIGGWVRLEIADHYNGSMTTGPFAADLNNRTTNNLTWRTRGYITADARNQTEYGTLRSYIAVGLSGDDNANASGTAAIANPSFTANRAFIQWAGFTFGLANSFYDFYSSPATAYFGSYAGSDSGDGGWKLLAYTAQFGNGFSGTISAEVPRQTQIINVGLANQANVGGVSIVAGSIAPGVGGCGSAVPSAAPAAGAGLVGAGTGVANGGCGAYAGTNVPDIVGNLRVDQAWGSAQVMGAAHLVRANYYLTGASPFIGEAANYPDDKWGYALAAGIKLLNPAWGPGDYFQGMISYTKGASRYNFMNPNFNHGLRNGDQIAWGVMSDAVYGGNHVPPDNTTGLELTATWAINAAYEHFWNPAWRTSVYGGYSQVNYSGLANAMLCDAETFGNGIGNGTFAIANAGCDNDWSTWWVGTRTQWNVSKDFYMGLDVIYQKLQSASTGHANNASPFAFTTGRAIVGRGIAGATSALFNSDEENIGFRFRVHRDFYP